MSLFSPTDNVVPFIIVILKWKSHRHDILVFTCVSITLFKTCTCKEALLIWKPDSIANISLQRIQTVTTKKLTIAQRNQLCQQDYFHNISKSNNMHYRSHMLVSPTQLPYNLCWDSTRRGNSQTCSCTQSVLKMGEVV